MIETAVMHSVDSKDEQRISVFSEVSETSVKSENDDSQVRSSC